MAGLFVVSTDQKWLILGVLAVTVTSSLVFIGEPIRVLAPAPFYMMMLAWSMPYGYIVVMSIIYVIEFSLIRNRKNFGTFILILAIFFSVLDIWYFYGAWEFGVEYQGYTYTKIVAIGNMVGFASLVILSYLGVKTKSRTLQHSANLFLFLLLSWYAFPYLGELP